LLLRPEGKRLVRRVQGLGFLVIAGLPGGEGGQGEFDQPLLFRGGGDTGRFSLLAEVSLHSSRLASPLVALRILAIGGR
jgi:hypothetical protein